MRGAETNYFQAGGRGHTDTCHLPVSLMNPDREKIIVPPNLVYSPVLGHLLFTLGGGTNSTA